MNLYKFGGVLAAVLFAIVSCNGTATTSSSPLNQNQSKSKSDETRYSLDLDKPEVEQSIALAEADVANAKFVQVEVTQVTNPQHRPARFQVYFQPRDGEKMLLGSFSLYPQRKHGKFIVPTQGKVKGEGKLILALAKSDRTTTGDVVRVEVKPLKFVADVDH